MSGSAVTVLLMAAEDLGRPELQAVLESSAEAWAREVAPGAVERVGAGESLADALAQGFAGHGGPALVAWPWLAEFRRELAVAALGDFEAGCDVVLGPVIDGGLYLLGLARPLPELLSVAEDRWQDPDVMTIAFAAAQESGLEVGLLRAERALRSAPDIKAALADPLLPRQIRCILAPAASGRSS